MKSFKEILKEIKKYNNVVIARHIGADPDALGSQFSLKELIQTNFKNKSVYAVGSIASRFRFMGTLDKIDDLNPQESLLIVLDTPDKKRIEGIDNLEEFASVIKIDHHPFVEKYGNIEYIEDQASSTSQLIFKFALDNKLKLTKKIAENIYFKGHVRHFFSLDYLKSKLNKFDIIEIGEDAHKYNDWDSSFVYAMIKK